MDTGPEMEKQQDHFAAPLNPEEVMASLKALRENYQGETETAANSAKTANSQSRISQISHFSREFEFEDVRSLKIRYEDG